MARQTRKRNPGDAANVFVRVILSDAGTILGGLTEDEWKQTCAYFDGRCAYTGGELASDDVDRDHAVPMNREHCGIHLFGNVLPTTKEVNRRKANRHYREFVESQVLLDRIEAFIADSGYRERVAVFGDLRHYCEAQYRAIDALCRVNKKYLQSLLPEDARNGEARISPSLKATPPLLSSRDILPITLVPSPAEVFKRVLLRKKHAWIVVTYQDGREEVRFWKASQISRTSNIIGNLRSRPEFRAGAWQRNVITGLRVSIERP